MSGYNLLPMAIADIGVYLLANAVAVVLAMGLDAWLGEPERFHPLVGFGHLVGRIESGCRRMSLLNLRQQGRLAWVLAVLPWVAASLVLLVLVSGSLLLWMILNTLVLYLAIGGKSLLQHADRIYRPLKAGDIDGAREAVAMIVSRNTQAMDERAITSAAIESVLENGNDAVFAPLFWFALLGAPGAVLFRLANTLDAMWGYRNERYVDFGRFSARVDDALGYLPARVCALCYALLGRFGSAMSCWRRQAGLCASPNGGVVMTAGAGALSVTIGGPAYYHGVLKDKPLMGCGEFAHWRAIPRANRLVARGSWGLSLAWLAVCLGLTLAY